MLLLFESQSPDEDGDAEKYVHVDDNGRDDTAFDCFECMGTMTAFEQNHEKQKYLDRDGTEGQNETGIGLLQAVGKNFGNFGDGKREGCDTKARKECGQIGLAYCVEKKGQGGEKDAGHYIPVILDEFT